MATLYVANCTGQNRLINYRLDYTVDDQGNHIGSRFVPFKSQLIPARQQQAFAGNLHPVQVNEIVGQLERSCGAVHADQVRTAKKMGVVKLIWQQDKPITAAILRDVVEHNMDLLSDEGAQRRRRLALAANIQLGQLIEKTPPKFEVEFEQVEEDPDLPGKLEEGLRLAQAPEPKPSRRRRAAHA